MGKKETPFSIRKWVKQRTHFRAKGERLFSSVFTLYSKLKNGQKGNLLLPGALLVTMQTQLLAPFVSVNFRLAAFFE